MQCPHCRTDNRQGRRFCAACGGALPMPCASCGFVNEPAERFCGGCGMALASPAAASVPPTAPAATASADRRPVTVMFADLAGYTALSGSLDPEDSHRLLRRFFEVVDGIVIGFGGTIDKHIGDSVMALFGAPVAHGDDPERAVRAAVDIQAAMPGLASESGHKLRVHVGIALGEVVASGIGSVAHSAYTVTGEAANLAARLMERAAPGETLVADNLRRATASVAAFEEVGAERFKGLPQPELIHRLVGLRTDRTAGPVMVGRQGELTQLLTVLDACRDSGRGGAVAIRGEPGIGKSTLLRELTVATAGRGVRYIFGRVLDFGAHRGEDTLAVVTATLLGCVAEAPTEAKLTAIAEAVRQGRVSEPARPFLLDLLGVALPPDSQAVYAAMDARARRRGKGAALAQLLHAASREQPLLICIEDVHWANADMLHLLARLVSAAGTCAAVVVMTTRVEGDPLDAAWRAQSGGEPSVVIDLRPLRPQDAANLASAIESEIDEFVRQCIDRAEGNPLFLEQLLRSRRDGGGKLPHSLQGVVLARLDTLPEADRRALQAASVLGQRFDPEDLAALLGGASHDCTRMVQRQLLRPDGDSYLFAHALIRDGVYASLTRERKRELHAKAAARFVDRDPALRAEHLDRAEDPAAARAYLRAAEVEAEAYRLERATALATRGLELATERDDIVKLGLIAGRLRLDAGMAKSAREAFAAAAAVTIDDHDRCRTLIGLAAADRILADLDKAMESLGTAESIAGAAGMPALLSEIHYMRGNLQFALGRSEACLREHRLALEAAERADAPEWKARALSGLGDAAYMQGRVATALAHFRDCVELAGRHKLLRVTPPNQCMIGNCMAYGLQFDGALVEIAAARVAAGRIGDRFGEMFAGECEAFVLYAAERFQEAEAPAEAALGLAVRLGARRYEAILQTILGRVRLAQHRSKEARELLDLAMRRAEETGMGFCGPLICGVQALICGPNDAGREWIARGEALLPQGMLVHNHVFFRKTAIDWAIDAGDWTMVERLAQALSEYVVAEDNEYAEFFVSRARALAALARNPQDLQAAEAMKRLSATARAVDLRI